MTVLGQNIFVHYFVEKETSGIPTGMHLIFSKPLACEESQFVRGEITS